jgi:hypothetical protein
MLQANINPDTKEIASVQLAKYHKHTIRYRLPRNQAIIAKVPQSQTLLRPIAASPPLKLDSIIRFMPNDVRWTRTEALEPPSLITVIRIV